MTEVAGENAQMEHEKSWSVFRFRDLRFFCFARFLATIASNAQNVAIGWFVYDLTHSAWSLGLTGLFTFLPVLFLALVTGQVADIYDRRLIVGLSYTVTAAMSVGLLIYSLTGAHAVWPIYVLAASIGAARSFGNPASKSLLPNLVPREMFPRALAWTSSFDTFAQTAGPSIGGLLYMLGAQVVFAMSAICYAAAAAGMFAIRTRTERSHREKTSWQTISAGARYIVTQKTLLGAVTLDMVAVCLGGVTALLPIFSDALGASAWGTGLLRSAQSIGALCMAYALALIPLRRKSGIKMLASVAVYGAAIFCFGLSTNIYIAIAALFAAGAADQVSVFIRQTIVQADTPDAMRGRVSALNVIFVGATTSLGEFESGVLASLVGAAPAVLIGGAGAVLCAGLWALLFPILRKRDHLIIQQPARETAA
jgi:MFS family permease